MRQYKIDFTGVKTIWSLHEVLKKELSFPSYYGMNLDALCDCLTSDIEHPCTIYVKGLRNFPKDMTNEVDTMLKIFNRAEKWYADLNLTVHFVIED